MAQTLDSFPRTGPSKILSHSLSRSEPFAHHRPSFTSHTPTKSSSGHVFVRDPPRERLGTVAGSPAQERPLTLARVAGKSSSQQSQQDLQHPPSSFFHTSPRRAITFRKGRRMAKKRRSLQTILIPSFFHSPLTSPTSPTPPRSPTSVIDANYFVPPVDAPQPNPAITSPRASPPPSFLLDDDPFANLTSAPSEVQRNPPAVQSSPSKPVGVKPAQPRSPLTPASFDRISMSTPSSPPSVRSHSRAASKSVSGRMPVPAYQKPAFAPKPSLPSLDALSRMNFVLPKKVRKGRVGAGLPFEPWDHLEDIASCATPASQRPSTSPTSTPSGFVLNPDVDENLSSALAFEPLEQPEIVADASFSVTNSVLVAAEEAFQSAPLKRASEITVELQSHHDSSPDDSARSFTTDQTAQAGLPADDTVTPSTNTSSSVNHITNSSTTSPSLPDFTLSLSHDDTLDESELPYTTDTEPSLPALSPSGCSLNESFTSSLSRSTSTSSSGSDDFGVSEPTSRYGNEDHNDIDGLAAPPRDLSSAVGEDDLLNSSTLEEEYYFSFPTAYTSETAAAISSWRHDTHTRAEGFSFNHDHNDAEGQGTSEAITSVTSVYSNCAGEPDMLMHRQLLPGTPGGYRPAMPRYVGDQNEGGLVDGAEYDPYRGGGSSSSGSHSYGQSRTYNYGSNGTPVSRRSAASGGSGSGRGNDDDGRNRRRPSRPSMFSNTSSSSEVTSDEEDESADDNVPLARSIPTALTAQKSIRKQVREERDQKRRERAERVGRTEARSRQTTLRPAGAGGPAVSQAVLSSSQEAALHAHSSSSIKPATRQRTQTLPGRAAPPFSAEDLTKKLQDVQVSSLQHHRYPSGATGDVNAFGGLVKPENVAAVATPESFTPPQPSRALRPARSFHRPQARLTMDDHHSVPLPPNATQQLHRARSRSRLREDNQKPAFEDAQRVPVPRISDDQRRLAREPSVRSASTRPSMEGDRERERGRAHSRRPSTADREHRPPMPPPPSTMPEMPKQVTQQRVFIGDMQRYNVVEIDDTTSAGDVIQMVESQGSLKGWIGSGEWMVWEVSHDFGMERPIRHFERLSDVQASWNKDKLVNTFVLRLTSLAPLLSRSAIPSSSPTHAGYVEWESKRGKWSKRWLQLREHSLWISKRDNGKDQTLLCSLSNFDAYHFCRPYKSPKPFAFAVKSTDKLSFFENALDYKHIISCSEKDGKIWMEKILLARSYVLHQERNILFNPKSYGGQPTIATGGLSRAPTQRRPVQPLVSVANNDLFEPGSLLHRKG